MTSAVLGFLEGYLMKTAEDAVPTTASTASQEAFTRNKVRRLETQIKAPVVESGQDAMDLKTQQQQQIAQNPTVPSTYGG